MRDTKRWIEIERESNEEQGRKKCFLNVRTIDTDRVEEYDCCFDFSHLETVAGKSCNFILDSILYSWIVNNFEQF